ncbi:MAG: winged helix-turn-helix transcriptional regulator [Desulfobacterales bacterium]|nr:MAG: winged helix-turn-helix transcriptional regulator [Desulfobacterales bacterium]
MHHPLSEWTTAVLAQWKMIQPYSSQYLTPTKDFRRLSVLLCIHDAPSASQHKIAQSSKLSSSMVNNYIKLFKEEKLITVEGDTNRTLSYHLTSLGHSALRESLLSYSIEIMQLYSSAKQEIAQILNDFYEEGIRSLVLFGAADTAEVVHAAIKLTPIVVIGVVDSDKAKQGRTFNGLVVQPPETLRRLEPDAVLITSFAWQEEIHAHIRQMVSNRIKVKKLSDL